MNLPNTFTINSQKVTIKLVDVLPDEKFGEYDCVRECINIAKNVVYNGEKIPLTTEQIINTFWHEVLHTFQWHSSGDFSETESNTYAGYLTELTKSTNLIDYFDEQKF